MSDAPDPKRIGDYEIEGLLGAGGMAKVYKAKHAILETFHAIKVLDPEYRANAEARKRFLDEAKIQAKHLDHANIVKVTNIVATAEHAALVMELIEGASLESHIAALKSQPAEIKRIMLGVLDAVGYAHKAGIIHRDLKPANVLLAKRGKELVPKVTDFGIAKVTAPDESKAGKKSTHAAARMGTLSYMSPEQIRRAKDVTARSDVFSLGAMLYEMATGDMAFGGDSDYDVMENIVNGRYRAPTGIDPVLAAVIKKALEPDPNARFASCAEMAAALRGEATLAPPPTPPKPPTPTPSTPKPPAPKPKPEPAPVAASEAPSSKLGPVIVLVLAALVLGGAAMFLAMRKSDDTPTSAGSGVPVVAATIDAGTEKPMRVPKVLRMPADAAVEPSRPDAAIAIESPPDAAVAVVEPPKPSPPPPQNPCAGSWRSGSDLSLTIRGTGSACSGGYAFVDTSGSSIASCGGSLQSCRFSGGTTTASFSCSYNRGTLRPLEGTMSITCNGRSGTARINMPSGTRNWPLRK